MRLIGTEFKGTQKDVKTETIEPNVLECPLDRDTAYELCSDFKRRTDSGSPIQSADRIFSAVLAVTPVFGIFREGRDSFRGRYPDRLGQDGGHGVAEPAFLIATSAGEVGVDLDTDHMVCDLVAWERMVQRLGRLNRRGEGDAKIIVVLEPEPKPKKAVAGALSKPEADRTERDRKGITAFEAEREKSVAQTLAFRRPFDEAPLRREDGTIDASPGAVRDLKKHAASDEALRMLIETAMPVRSRSIFRGDSPRPH